MNIQKAQSADIGALYELVNSAYRGESSKKGWTTEADLLGGQRIDIARLQEMLSTDKAVILKGCTPEGKIVACVYLEKQGSSCYLGMLTVSPELQNTGFGKILLKECEVVARDHLNCGGIHMNVITTREELIQWYLRRGYILTQEYKPFPMTDPRFGIPKVEKIEFVVLRKTIY